MGIMITRALSVTDAGSDEEYATTQSVILGITVSAFNMPEFRVITPVTLLISKSTPLSVMKLL